MKNDCKIVQDLLPNYIEKVTSKETNEYIEEHMKNCEECSKIYKEMSQELKVTSLDTKMEVDYMKKFNGEVKKLKLWKKILIVIVGILFIYVLIALYKYNVLTKIYEKNKASNEMSNLYYYWESDTTITECWRKDDIEKMQMKEKGKDVTSVTWQNSNTKENYSYWNQLGQISSVKSREDWIMDFDITSDFAVKESKFRILMAIDPLMFIIPKKYDNKKCYYLKGFEITEIVDKKDGLILRTTNLGNRTYKYSFNTVTDEDVAKPDLTGYEKNE